MLKRGGTIGILGGGQLGRMMAIAAAQLGYRCIGYAPQGDNVAEEVCADFFTNKWNDAQAMAAFAQKCDVITWEFENVPVGPLEPIAGQLAPHPRALETAQDRLNEKRFVEQLGGRPAPCVPVAIRGDLTEAVERIGLPGILKTRRDGYDGKGQWRLRDRQDVEGLSFKGEDCIYEGFVEFEAEFSVILVRGQDGEIRFWESTRNIHEGGILAASHYPAGSEIAAQVDEARELARKVADALKYVGVLTLEFFATNAGPVFNEMAPRVHNSGHWTIEGAATSQFENHIRAVAGLPLGDTRTTAAKIEMRNILGSEIDGAHALLSDGRLHLHDYGKAEASEGRKMGHTTHITLNTRT